ncbi:zinc ribbon domain-containing protein [Lactonifactor sp. BIOML-A7]|uniref:zinc ribbon domain-containing protein n=1 Tax=Lactonifactor sp. BIOML-A7 TaxID=2584660 RepID=UPI00325AA16A
MPIKCGILSIPGGTRFCMLSGQVSENHAQKGSIPVFFIMGISQGRKNIEYVKTVICSSCGKYGRYEVYMTYSCFSLFFIPLFKWDRHYYAETTCCHTLYEITPEIGRQIMRGDAVELREEDLIRIKRGQGSFLGWTNEAAKGTRICSDCGYEGEKDFVYCPKCGKRLEE